LARILGIDFGSKRIGVALSDPTGTICSPLGVIQNQGLEKSARELVRLAREREAAEFVVGLPLNMNGSEGPSARAARRLAEKLEQFSSLPVHLWDERLTSAAAERAMIQGDLSRGKRAKRIDKVAAQMILQSFLQNRSRGGQSDEAP